MASEGLFIAPRLEKVSFSLYWKEPISVDTKVAPVKAPPKAKVSRYLLIGSYTTTHTGAQVAEAAASLLGWPAEAELVRLDGYNETWSRVLHNGRDIPLDTSLASAGVKEGDTLVVVRRVLKADGWAIVQDGDFLDSDSDDDDMN